MANNEYTKILIMGKRSDVDMALMEIPLNIADVSYVSIEGEQKFICIETECRWGAYREFKIYNNPCILETATKDRDINIYVTCESMEFAHTEKYEFSCGNKRYQKFEPWGEPDYEDGFNPYDEEYEGEYEGFNNLPF